jgi:hypothetical protein
MVGSANGLEVPKCLADEAPVDAAFEGRFSQCFQRLGVKTIGDLRRVPRAAFVSDELYDLNARLRRCWWFW